MQYFYGSPGVKGFLADNANSHINFNAAAPPGDERISFGVTNGLYVGGHPGGSWNAVGMEVNGANVDIGAQSYGGNGRVRVTGNLDAFLDVGGITDRIAMYTSTGDVDIDCGYQMTVWGENGVAIQSMPGWENVFGQSGGAYFRAQYQGDAILVCGAGREIFLQGPVRIPLQGTNDHQFTATNTLINGSAGTVSVYGRNIGIENSYVGTLSKLELLESGVINLDTRNGALNLNGVGVNITEENSNASFTMGTGGALSLDGTSPYGSVYLGGYGGGKGYVRVGNGYGGVSIGAYQYGNHFIQTTSGDITVDPSSGYLHLGNSANAVNLGTSGTPQVNIGGANTYLSFFGAGAVQRPQVPGVGYVSAQDITTALVSLGLISQAP